jgi:sodium-dependent dicarboxylate transporter 2/3/5
MTSTPASASGEPGRGTPVLTESSGPHELEATLAALSPGEQRFERWRQTVGLFAGPPILLALLFVPIAGVSPQAHRLAAVVGFVVVWWITEPIPLAATALVGTALTVVLGVAPATEAFAPFASPTIFLFIGSFMIGRAASEHGLDRRIAHALLALPAARAHLAGAVATMCLLTLLISAWMSNSATTAMMVPVATGVLDAARRAGRLPRSAPAASLLGIAYAASIGGIITPVGTPPNLITLGLLEKIAGVRINFLVWMLVATPISLAMALALFGLMAPRLRGGASAAGGGPAPATTEARQPWTRAQANVALAFTLAIVGWVTPGVASLLWPGAAGTAWLAAHLDEAVVAVLAASLLFTLPVDFARRKFTLGWDSAAGIDWGTILLFGGGLALGRLMFTTGLAAVLGQHLVEISGAESLWGITALGLVAAVLLTEVTSNTAATNMLVPVILSVAQASGVSPVPPALGVCLGASMAFMLPVSTPPNAIVYGTGRVPVMFMLRHGIIMDVIGIAIIFVGLRLLCPLVGLV